MTAPFGCETCQPGSGNISAHDAHNAKNVRAFLIANVWDYTYAYFHPTNPPGQTQKAELISHRRVLYRLVRHLDQLLGPCSSLNRNFGYAG